MKEVETKIIPPNKQGSILNFISDVAQLPDMSNLIHYNSQYHIYKKKDNWLFLPLTWDYRFWSIGLLMVAGMCTCWEPEI